LAGVFFRKIRWALALAGRGRGDGLRRRRGQWLWGGPLPDADAIPPALVAASLLAVVGGAIALRGVPAAPAAGGVLAVGTAIACLGPGREEPPFAALEQTAPAAGMVAAQGGRPVGVLTGSRRLARVV
jgi:hypothetical protein